MSEKETGRGQALLVVAALLFVIMALIALVIDGGNAFAQRRIAQNAVDAGVLAGIQDLAVEFEKDTPTLTEQDLWARITDYTAKNHLEESAVRAWYVDIDGERIKEIKPVGGSLVHKKILVGGVERDLNGLEVDGALPFDTYFARLLGFDAMTARARAKAWVWCGVCQEECLFPIALDASDPPTGTFTTPYTMTMWDADKEAPGNFGWVYWEGEDLEGNYKSGELPQGPSLRNLEDNILDSSRSLQWQVGEVLYGDPGQNFPPTLNELWRRIDPTDPLTNVVVVPLYDDFMVSGNNAVFTITGFALFELTCAFQPTGQGQAPGHIRERSEGDCNKCKAGFENPKKPGEYIVDKCIAGNLLDPDFDLKAEGHCADYDNICTYKLRKPEQK